jgi:hypothetical protein
VVCLAQSAAIRCGSPCSGSAASANGRATHVEACRCAAAGAAAPQDRPLHARAAGQSVAPGADAAASGEAADAAQDEGCWEEYDMAGCFMDDDCGDGGCVGGGGHK